VTHILKTTLLATALTAMIAVPAHAGIADGWSGEAALTGSKTTGNTETEDLWVILRPGLLSALIIILTCLLAVRKLTR